jgi:hypothetical protein
VIKPIAFLVVAGLAVSPARALADGGNDVPCCTTDIRPPCIDDTDIVGYRRCPHYGAWGSNLLEPDAFVQVGVNMRHLPARGPVGAAARTTMPSSSSGQDAGDDVYTLVERVGYPVTHHLYLAFDFELGNLEGASPSKPWKRDIVMDALAAAGLRGGIGPIALSAEIAGGVMQSAAMSQNDVDTTAVFEARGRGDIWLTPWCTVGVVVGKSLLDHPDWMAGLYLGVHTWAFAGER